VIFEWDDEKNRANIRKHGFDFNDAWEIFEGPMVINADKRFDYGEARLIGIGWLSKRVVTIVFTEPDDDTIRVVSLRKATKYEREQFERTLRDRLG
jgi:uncharacterized DUF497 family protein